MKKHDENWSLFRLSDRKQFDDVNLETIDFFFRALSEKTRFEWLMWREGFSSWRPLGELPLILKHLQKDDETSTPPPVPESVLKYADEITGVRQGVAPEPDSAREPMSQSLSSVSRTHVSNPAMRVPGLKAAPPTTETPPPFELEPVKPANRSARADLADNARVIPMSDEATLSLMLESQAASEDRGNVRYQKKFKVRIFTPKGIVSVVTTDCSTSGFRLKEPLPPGLPRFFHVELDLGPEGKIPLVCSEIREKDGRAPTRVRIQVNDHMNLLKSALVRAA